MTPARSAPFGRVLTAMVTPFSADGSLDVDGAQQLSTRLVDEGNDGLVISGTTGEAPTTTDEEKDRLLRAVVEAVGQRATVVAGVGTFDTAHSEHLAQAAKGAGADGLLVVTPYYSKPPQAGVVAHVRRVAAAGDLPVMLYDIPGRTGLALAPDTLVALAEHSLVVAVKDAKGDLAAVGDALDRTDLAYYSGSDELNLPLLALGAVGVVSVIGHLVTRQLVELADMHEAGRNAEAAALHLRLLRVQRALFRTQGVLTTKASLRARGLPAGPVRLPLVDLTESEESTLRADLAHAGIPLERVA